MKKLLLPLCLFLLISCSKNDDKNEQTFFANIYTQYSSTSEERIADGSYVYLFEKTGKTIDKDKSYRGVYYDNTLTYTDGTTARPKYKSSSTNGINIFEDIPNGQYILFVTLVSYGYVDGASLKKIIVNEDYNVTTEKKVFLYRGSGSSENYGYQDWNEKW